MIKSMGMEHFTGLMAGNIQENGKTGSKMGKVLILVVIQY